MQIALQTLSVIFELVVSAAQKEKSLEIILLEMNLLKAIYAFLLLVAVYQRLAQKIL